MTTILQLAAAKTEPDELLRNARTVHILEYERDLHGHGERFEHCPVWFCREARRISGLDERQVDLFARSHGQREPGE